MAILGRFETVREISQTGLGSVWTAREAGAAGQSLTASAMLRSTLAPGERYVIKLFQPLGYIPGDPAFDAEIDAFLRRCEVQRGLARAGAKRWARVHDAGRFDEGAYAVIDAQPRSAHQLILRKVDLWRSGDPRDPGATLRAIVKGVVEALQELARHRSGRGHGALKPSNILLAGDGPVASARPILTDPLPDDPARAAEFARRDRRDLGGLIYQLVTHRPFRELAAWPVEDGPEWRAFGRRGGTRWLDLCNRLLDPRAASGPGLDEVAAELEAWPAEPPRRQVPAVIALSVLLLAGGGAAVWYATRPPPRPMLVLVGGQLDQLKDDINWIDALAPIAGDPVIAAAARSDPALDRIVAPVRDYTTSDSLSAAIKYLRYERAKGDPEPTAYDIKAGVSDLWRVYEPFTRELAQWPAAARLDALAKSFDDRGWPGAARAVAEARARLDAVLAARPSARAEAGPDAGQPGPDLRPADAIRGALNALRAGDDVEAAWAALTRRSADLAGLDDAVLKLLPRAIEGRARAASESKDPLQTLRRTLAELAALTDDLDAARAAHYAKADLEYFAELSEVHQKLAALGSEPTPEQAMELLRAWPAEIADPRFIREPIGDVWAGRAVQDEVAAAAADLKRLEAKRQPGDEARLDPMNEHLARAQEQLATLTKKLEAPRRREYDAIRAGARDLLAGLDVLQTEIADLKELRLQAFEAYLPKFRARALESGSSALDAEFLRARDAIDRAHAGSKDIGELRDRADRVAKVLGSLNALPQVEGLTGPAARVAETEREAVLAEAIAQLPRDAEGLPLADAATSAEFAAFWERRTAAYEAWLSEARAALVEAGALDELLADGYGPGDDAGGGSIADRWAGLARQPAAAKLFEQEPALRASGDRIAAMQQLESVADPATLLTLLEAPDTPLAEGLTAWNRLRALNNPPWPGSAADLERAATVASTALPRLAEEARSAERRTALARWAKEELARAWLNGFESLPAEAAEIEAAVAMAPRFGVTESYLSQLSPPARFNLLTAELHSELRAAGPTPEDDTVRARLRRYDAEVAALGLSNPAAAELTGSLRALVEAPPKKEVDLATVGPGSAGWAKTDAAADGAWVVYTAPGGAAPPLRFIRVTDGQAPGGAPAAYLCEVETSLAVFSAIIESARAGEELAKLVPRLDADPDPRKGPSAWSFVRKDARGPSRSPVELRTPDARRVGQGWLNVVAGMDRGEAYYPPGLQVTPPTPDCPMNYLPATVAIYSARLAGCRLPTPGEWAAATAMNGPGAANIRDKPWKDQHAFIQAQREAGKVNAPWPDEDIFVPEEQKAPISARRRRTALPVTDQPVDGALWFLPVGAPGHGEPFKHLRGNVAELLFENSARLDALSPAAVLGTSDWSGLRIAGASALSPVEVSADAVYGATSANAYYSDVGFRLAFSAGEGKPKPLATQAGQILAAARYLPAR